MRYLLGIDTGGTFTDAVLLDAAHQVVAAVKSLTTPFDLSQGIGNALDGLPVDLLAAVDMVSLSTTLTTNSVVEGKGAPVCVLLAGYDAAQIKASGLVELVVGRDSPIFAEFQGSPVLTQRLREALQARGFELATDASSSKATA